MDAGGSGAGLAASPSEDPQQFAGGILRKKLYDQNLSDWSARYRKNKQNLDALIKDCDILRQDVGKAQREADERADGFKNLEDHFENVTFQKYQDTKAAYEAALTQKASLQAQISDHRKHKTALAREKKTLRNDYERKHAECMRMREVQDKLDLQLRTLTQQLGGLTSDRRHMERELDEVQHNLKRNTDLADEESSDLADMQGGIRNSMDLCMTPAERVNTSIGSIPSQSHEGEA